MPSAVTSLSPDHDEFKEKLTQGKELYRAGNLRAAAESLAEATRLDPDSAEAQYTLAFVLEQLGEAGAMERYDRALAIDARMVKALINSGNMLRSRGQLAAAEARYRSALEINPDDVHALNNLGALAFNRGDLKGARVMYQRAAAFGRMDARMGLAATAFREGNWEEAEAEYRRILEIEPGTIAAMDGLAKTLAESGRRDEAHAVLVHALEMDSSNALVLNTLGCLALEEGNFGESRRFFDRLASAPSRSPEAQYNLALFALWDKDFARGWDGYELRLQVDTRNTGVTLPGIPRLQPDNIAAARRVAVPKEQGVGDQILFSTLLPELRDSGVESVVEVDPRLIATYRRSLGGIEFVAPDDAARAWASCDHQLPLGSLPRLFRRDVESFSRGTRNFLLPDDELLAQIDHRLPKGFRIAISWKSLQLGNRAWVSKRKSAALDRFSSVAGLGATLVDLQYGDAEEERRGFDARYPGLRAEVPNLDLYNDLEGVLAAIAACDLVITTSNVLAHLAGAIGRETWLLFLSAAPPFHYWAPRPDGKSLWYPSVEIMSHAKWKDWDQPFEAASARLAARLK